MPVLLWSLFLLHQVEFVSPAVSSELCVYVSPSFYLICLHEVLPAWTELQATILFSQLRIQKRHWINIHWLDQVYLFKIPKWILLFQSEETYTWISWSAEFLDVCYSNQSLFESLRSQISFTCIHTIQRFKYY